MNVLKEHKKYIFKVCSVCKKRTEKWEKIEICENCGSECFEHVLLTLEEMETMQGNIKIKF